jgi:hypothetical protein
MMLATPMHYRSMMATKILQASQTLQDASTMAGTIPSRYHLPTPTLRCLQFPKKMFNAALDCLRSQQQQQQLLQLPPFRPVELHDHCKKLRRNLLAVRWHVNSNCVPFVSILGSLLVFQSISLQIIMVEIKTYACFAV